MRFAVIKSEYAARRDDTSPGYRTMGEKLSSVLSSAWKQLPDEFQKQLALHWGDDGPRVEILDLPAGWRAAADIRGGCTIWFAPSAVGLPHYVLFHIVGEEMLHCLQVALGRRFASKGEYERDVDSLLALCGFDRRAAFDFNAGMYSTRRVSDEEWAAIQERHRYAMQ